MNLFEFEKDKFEVTFSPMILNIPVFKKVIDRDKTKWKELARKEIQFVYLYADLKSDYMYIIDKQERYEEIKKDLELPKTWKIDPDLEKVISFYEEHSKTVNSAMYEAAQIAADAVNDVCRNAKTHIASAEDPIAAAQKVTGILEKIPKTMANLSAAYHELIKEQKVTEGRSKGSRNFNMFEDGISLDEEDEDAGNE